MPIKDPEARKAYQREYAQRNREKAYQRVKEWRAANPGARTEEARKYRAKYPEREREKVLRWKKANPEAAAATSKQTRLKNKDRVNANKAFYRASRRNKTPVWLTKFDRLKMRCMYSVALMLSRENKEAWEVDHIIPLNGKNVSGLHVPSNLQVIRASENRLKNAKYEVTYA
jgi:5-methylcytosine-specific restriction endonuclease McrA